MSAIQRGLRNPFRNKVRTTVVLILLSLIIGLFAVMVQSAFQTQKQLENLQAHLRTLIELREATVSLLTDKGEKVALSVVMKPQ